MKRMTAIFLAFLLAAALLTPALGEETEDPLAWFRVSHGSRSEKKIAVTVDDCFDLAFTWKIRDLLQEQGVVATFFPIGVMIKPEDKSEWQKILDNGNEIGSHNIGHYNMGNKDAWSIIRSLGMFQETLDSVLGYHYQVHCFRPPYGKTSDDKNRPATFTNAVNRFGYEHVILWDVSQTNPKLAITSVQNGSILLYHARMQDYNCLQELIPQLLDQGYELVTVSELLGFGENEISPEPYVYNRADYEDPV